jgi:hypothetical protein
MHRLLFGLALVSLMACHHAFAGDVPISDSVGPPAVQKPPAPSRLHAPKTVKPVARIQSDGHSKPRPLPLSSAAAYASEHAADLPVSSAPKMTTPSTSRWTGFYVGVGAGVGTNQP